MTVLAHQLARAVSDMGQRGVACALSPFFHAEGSGAGEPAASLGPPGRSLATVRGHAGFPGVDERL